MRGLAEPWRTHYLTGQCRALAAALQDRTGWPVVEVFAGGVDYWGGRHILVQMPDGRLLDAAGVHAPDERGFEILRTLDLSGMDERLWRRPANMTAAGQLLAQLDKDEEAVT